MFVNTQIYKNQMDKIQLFKKKKEIGLIVKVISIGFHSWIRLKFAHPFCEVRSAT